MQTHAKKRLSILLAIPLAICGCASLKPARMAPQPTAMSSSKIDASVRVMDVSGGRKSQFGGPQMIEDDQYKEALILALQQSGLFREVSSDRGDLALHATIRSQDQKVSRGLQYTATMVVTYRFTDSAGNLVWSASYDSEFSSTAFAGATRTVRAREGSARENLTSLVRGIREEWRNK
ncbi:MAG TPA: hypothetical protein VGD45_21105 [Steroidobacter sp.]|uniref:hypothetical protein n=1 Tax=Steroidobacter sp. TaxID=1978227 RepID=UPI002EDAA05E